MVDPITASYVQDDADWTITIAGNGAERSARAPGIIAARDHADQIIEEIAPDDGDRTVVHLLNGSAIEFTQVYLNARLNRGVSATKAGAESTSTDDADAPTTDAHTAHADTENPDAPAPVAATGAAVADPDSTARDADTARTGDDTSSGDNDETTTPNGALEGATEEPAELANATAAEEPSTTEPAEPPYSSS